MRILPKFTVMTGNGAAWRAIYIIGHQPNNRTPRPQRFRITLDPTGGYGPRYAQRARLTIAIGYRPDDWNERSAMYVFKFWLPRSKHWWRLDGRNKGGILGTFKPIPRR